MRAGCGKEKIVFPKELFPVEGYAGVLDDVYVRVLLLGEDTQNSACALIDFEMTSLREETVQAFKERIFSLTGIPADQILICVTHTFSVPHIRSEAEAEEEGEEAQKKNALLFSALVSAMERAVKKADDSREEVSFAYGYAESFVNVNRDVQTENGWWLGQNPDGFSDHMVPALWIRRADGSDKAVLFSLDLQSSLMNHAADEDGNLRITGDVAGAACRYLENAFGEEFAAFFFIGGGGDQAPRGPAGSYESVKELGKELGEAVKRSLETAEQERQPEGISLQSEVVSTPGQKIIPCLSDIHPKKEYSYEPEGERQVKVSYLAAGEAVFIGLAPELSSRTAKRIRGASPYALTIVATLTDGGAKYMPEEAAYDQITYEAMNSGFFKGSAELLEAAVKRRLQKEKEADKN